MDNKDYLANQDYIDELYRQYLHDSESVEPSWRSFFEGFETARQQYPVLPGKDFDSERKVLSLILEYRRRGHYFTATNPVRKRRAYSPTLDIENFGLTAADSEKEFNAGKEIGIGRAKLKDIVAFLKQTYCSSVGVEYQYIRKPEVVDWLRDKMESCRNNPSFSKEQKFHIYEHLVHAVGFESFIHKRFTGQKRFSLEGAESLIPALDAVIEKGSELGVDEFVIGMSHRGRLNVLANIMKKPYVNVFSEFSGKEYDDENILGDVKYHMGLDTDITTDKGRNAKLFLLHNPSHLETVGPVVQGFAHGRIQAIKDDTFSQVAPIVIHGDAALAAQGVVYETIQMSQLEGYKTGGTIHLVINNQVGFTTDYTEARSSIYCTDIAKVVWAPIFHVNGDDAEALVYTVQLAMEYRAEFHTDVFIDILCYRKYGHNEGDEPRFTQPLLYKQIAAHPNVRDIYMNQLLSAGVAGKETLTGIINDFDRQLETCFRKATESPVVHVQPFLNEIWRRFEHAHAAGIFAEVKTSVPEKELSDIAEAILKLPAEKKFFNKVYKIIEERKQLFSSGKTDWALAELLAYATLLAGGHPVRISGQDSVRGTFSHRHAAFVEEESGNKYFPLKNISQQQASFTIFNSLLSEYAVMGFEYGYALTHPEGLNIWEAQFGDFHNVAQVIVDQYLSSAEEKWGLMNGLVLLLPHGYEGQGPEHSSARIERFLTLCASDNMIVANCTTPANFFHLLRRQVKAAYRKPLIVFTPKSLLRHPKCISPLTDLSSGSFRPVIDDEVANHANVEQVVFCSGKIYYDLAAERERISDTHTALVRIEQLYPFPEKEVNRLLEKYSSSRRSVWVQEEPANMGGWYFVQRMMHGKDVLGICKPPSGSTDTGLLQQHLARQRKLLDKVFKRCDCNNKEVYCSMKCQG
jgi:2-oxoglutarate dehydrogenase E1 component